MQTTSINAGRAIAAAVASLTALVALTWPGGACAAPTGSIVYTKAGNVYRVRGDGSATRRVTRDGRRSRPYRNVTQADNGTVVAIRDYTTLSRFSRSGRRLGRPRRVASGLRNEGSLHDLALAAAVSPDGRRVALQNTLLQGTYDASTGTRGMNIISVSVEYRSAATGTKLAERHIPGDYLESPSWIDNGHVLIFRPTASYAEQMLVDTLGGELAGWYSDDIDGDDPFARKPLDAGELTRARDKLALIRGTNVDGDSSGASIVVYSVSGFGAKPAPACTIDHAGSGPLAKPTWSPDGTTLAWSDATGVWTSPVNPSAPGCGLAPRLIARGASAPDWGPSA